MTQELNKVDQVIGDYHKLKNETLKKFCEKQNLGVFGFMAYSDKEVICFSPELSMAFSDIFLDMALQLRKVLLFDTCKVSIWIWRMLR